ncbi:hypothetical protein BX666DRAFT_2024486 [Dichotomocladium elegans]|nr:hypothetical protein BX666DRAFT_2024486 [Dichotomocladium elegans]
MTHFEESPANIRQLASSKSLSMLASQLHSENDRQHYANVIYLAENLKRQIEQLQLGNAARNGSSPGPLRVDISSHVARSTQKADQNCRGPQDLDRYFRLLERSQSIKNTICRLSSHFDGADEIISSAPLHPPPSFPPPPTPGASPTGRHVFGIKDLPKLPITQTPPPTPKKQMDVPITPPESPSQQTMQVHFKSSSPLTPSLPPLPPKPPLTRIVHVHKRINGLRGFLTRTYQLSSDIVMSRALTTHLRLFTATQMLTGEPKAILKLVLTAFHENDINQPDLKVEQRGFSFYWPGGPRQPPVKPNRTYDAIQFASLPDSQVQEALDKWIERQAVLPPLRLASHILREGLKIYVVYNRILFNHLSPPTV